MTQVCVGKLTTLGSDNGLSPGRRQAIIWTNDGVLLIRKKTNAHDLSNFELAMEASYLSVSVI